MGTEFFSQTRLSALENFFEFFYRESFFVHSDYAICRFYCFLNIHIYNIYIYIYTHKQNRLSLRRGTVCSFFCLRHTARQTIGRFCEISGSYRDIDDICLLLVCYAANNGSSVDSSWDVMAHGFSWLGKWRENWRMEWVASTLHTTSQHGVSSITTTGLYRSSGQYVGPIHWNVLAEEVVERRWNFAVRGMRLVVVLWR